MSKIFSKSIISLILFSSVLSAGIGPPCYNFVLASNERKIHYSMCYYDHSGLNMWNVTLSWIDENRDPFEQKGALSSNSDFFPTKDGLLFLLNDENEKYYFCAFENARMIDKHLVRRSKRKRLKSENKTSVISIVSNDSRNQFNVNCVVANDETNALEKSANDIIIVFDDEPTHPVSSQNSLPSTQSFDDDTINDSD